MTHSSAYEPCPFFLRARAWMTLGLGGGLLVNAASLFGLMLLGVAATIGIVAVMVNCLSRTETVSEGVMESLVRLIAFGALATILFLATGAWDGALKDLVAFFPTRENFYDDNWFVGPICLWIAISFGVGLCLGLSTRAMAELSFS